MSKISKRLKAIERRLGALEKHTNLVTDEDIGVYRFPGHADSDTVQKEIDEAIRRVVQRHGGTTVNKVKAVKMPGTDNATVAKRMAKAIKNMTPKDRAEMFSKIEMLREALKPEDGESA